MTVNYNLEVLSLMQRVLCEVARSGNYKVDVADIPQIRELCNPNELQHNFNELRDHIYNDLQGRAVKPVELTKVVPGLTENGAKQLSRYYVARKEVNTVSLGTKIMF